MLCYLTLAVALSGNPLADRVTIYDQRSETALTVDQLADQVAAQDVVLVGEIHGNRHGHQFQLDLLAALHDRRPDLVLSLEMFERDVQGLLNDYLRGRIQEAEFLEHARPWRNYQQNYRPLVEFARQQQLEVLAANLPRPIAQAVARGERPGPADDPLVPRRSSSPRDAYWDRFVQVMQKHPGADQPQTLRQLYQAQCLKDDAMAETITDYRAQHPRPPLVVHLCGQFHSDYGHGIPIRILQRQPLLRLAVLSMEAMSEVDPDSDAGDIDYDRQRSHFLLVVPAPDQSETAESPTN